MKWIPNALTILRILLLPIVVVLLAAVPRSADSTAPLDPLEWTGTRLALVALYLLMAVSDWLDGYLARRLHAATRWGSMADGVADRLVLLVPLGYVALARPAAFPAIPAWVPLWLLALDVVTAAMWLAARWRYGVHRPATHRLAGRAGVWLLFTLVLWVMAALPAAAVIPLATAGLGLVTVSSALYIRRWFTLPSG